VKKVEKDEVILGLSLCFGRLAGWSEARQIWSHWSLLDVGVLYCKVDDKGKMVGESEVGGRQPFRRA
jgi:hypothetical protein